MIESIDGINYRIEVINGEAFIEPGHDRVQQSTTLAGFILYFTARSVYRVPLPEIGSATQPLSEASGPTAQERSAEEQTINLDPPAAVQTDPPTKET